MSAKQDGGSAFPRASRLINESAIAPGFRIETVSGMSLRDWFAGQALAGLLASAPKSHDARMVGHEEQAFSLAAYALADAMLAERSKP